MDVSNNRTFSLIFEATRNCCQQFEHYIALKDRVNRAHAEYLLQRLRTWATYSGALSREGLSLDDRLERHEDIRKSVLGLLEVVFHNLEQGMCPVMST